LYIEILEKAMKEWSPKTAFIICAFHYLGCVFTQPSFYLNGVFTPFRSLQKRRILRFKNREFAFFNLSSKKPWGVWTQATTPPPSPNDPASGLFFVLWSQPPPL
jgi:hypothetical protein